MKTIKTFVIALIIFTGLTTNVSAQSATVNLTLRSGDTIIFEGDVSLPETGTTDVNDSSGNPHPLNNQSVLALVRTADATDDTWEISDLQYFDSFGAFYLRCVDSVVDNDCDDWQYAVNGSTPFSSMDQSILSGGEEVYLYFGAPSRVVLDSNSIAPIDTLIVTTESYDFENNAWVERTGVTVGVTQPNPADAFSPIEVLTSPVDDSGQATFTGLAEGQYNVGVKEDYYFPTEALTVSTTPSSGGSGGSSSGGSSSKSKKTTNSNDVFDTEKALNFLISNQNMDGSFGEDIYTDWVAIALGTTEKYPFNKTALAKNIAQNTTKDLRLTDIERRALALMSLGVNPYNADGHNYIDKILAGFDGTQFGDANEDNDDIFALIVLKNVGFDMNDKEISGAVKFILGRQGENGSWDESTDMTGAAIEALSTFQDHQEVEDALDEARQYLRYNQKEDGGWMNVSATTWAMQGILALDNNLKEWKKKGGLTALQFLQENQDSDGGITSSSGVSSDEVILKNRIWETAYAVSATSGKSWNEAIPDYEKPEVLGTVLGASVEIAPAPKPKPAPKIAKIEAVKTEAPVPEETEAKEETQEENTGWLMKMLKSIF